MITVILYYHVMVLRALIVASDFAMIYVQFSMAISLHTVFYWTGVASSEEAWLMWMLLLSVTRTKGLNASRWWNLIVNNLNTYICVAVIYMFGKLHIMIGQLDRCLCIMKYNCLAHCTVIMYLVYIPLMITLI